MSRTDIACSTVSADVGESLAGTAPYAVAWVCLEQDGPWGAKAWTDSHLDADLGARIEALAEQHGVRPSLIRRPGRHPDPGVSTARQVLVGYTQPGGSWLVAGQVPAPEALVDLDWAALAGGDRAGVLASAPTLVPSDEPQLLVCTNGTRDTCCARLGRPVAGHAAEVFPGRVWETTHTSGHRFAATTVLLPSGTLHGRVLDATRLLVAADRGELELTGYRGRSTWSAGAQVAEDHIRRTENVLGIDDLTVEPAVDAWTVRHRDGRSWWVAVQATPGPGRPPSCGKDPEPATNFTPRTVTSR